MHYFYDNGFRQFRLQRAFFGLKFRQGVRANPFPDAINNVF